MMRYETSHRRLTKRANDFLGISLTQYLLGFTYLNGDRIVLNDNGSMQKAFAVWVAHGEHQEKLSAILQKRESVIDA